MLDNEKKKLIEAEEHYRHEIAAKLRSEAELIQNKAQKIEKDLWSKVIEVLNSNFGLWFLSVTKVVISVDVDEDVVVDELSDPPPPQDTNIAPEPKDKLNTRPILVNFLEKTTLYASSSDLIALNFISIPWILLSIH